MVSPMSGPMETVVEAMPNRLVDIASGLVAFIAGLPIVDSLCLSPIPIFFLRLVDAPDHKSMKALHSHAVTTPTEDVPVLIKLCVTTRFLIVLCPAMPPSELRPGMYSVLTEVPCPFTRRPVPRDGNTPAAFDHPTNSGYKIRGLPGSSHVSQHQHG